MMLEQDISRVVRGLARVYQLEGSTGLANLLSRSQINLVETGYDNWNGGTYTYALHVSASPEGFVGIFDIEAAEKELLARLKGFTRGYTNEHLEEVIIKPSLDSDFAVGPEIATESLGEEPPEAFRLFISHLAENSALALNISRAFQDKGIYGFVAHEHIEPAKEWEAEVRSVLSTMDGLVALLAPGFKESDWTDQETGVAVGRNVLVIPVRLGLDPYGFIAKYQGFQGVGRSPADIATGIFDILVKNDLTKRKMAHVVVHLFEQSRSFSAARSNMKMLESLHYLDVHLKDRLLKALAANDQIAKAWNMPERVHQLIKKFDFATLEEQTLS